VFCVFQREKRPQSRLSKTKRAQLQTSTKRTGAFEGEPTLAVRRPETICSLVTVGFGDKKNRDASFLCFKSRTKPWRLTPHRSALELRSLSLVARNASYSAARTRRPKAPGALHAPTLESGRAIGLRPSRVAVSCVGVDLGRALLNAGSSER
jgi:hypothetical protein